MSEPKLVIFDVLNAVNKKNAKYFNTLTEDEIKTIQPFVLMRWLTGTDDETQIMLLNEFVNPVAFPLTKHKELLWQLLTIANSGVRQRYTWPKLESKKESSKPIATALVKQAYGYNDSHAADALQLLTIEDLIDLAFDQGMPGEEITKLKKEMKK